MTTHLRWEALDKKIRKSEKFLEFKRINGSKTGEVKRLLSNFYVK